MIRRAMWKHDFFDHKSLFKIFDSLVVRILCYGSEVWGYEYQRKIEQVHINFCTSAVLGECGRLAIASYKVLCKIHQILAKDPQNGS